MAQTADSTPFPSDPQSTTTNGHTDGDVDMTDSITPHNDHAAFTANTETITQRPDHSPMSEAGISLPLPPIDQRTSLQPLMNGTIAPAPTPNPATQSYQPMPPNMHPPTPAAPTSMNSAPPLPSIKPDPTHLSRSGTPSINLTQINGTAINGISSTSTGVSAGHVIHSIHPHGSPTRVYLNSRVTPVVLEGMKYLAKHEPERPLAWFAEFLARRSRELEGTGGAEKDGLGEEMSLGS